MPNTPARPRNRGRSVQLEAPRPVRRPLGLTPLIDVVFLLLLFFMLASTFQKYGEIDLVAAGRGALAPAAERPLLVRVHEDGTLDLNARAVQPDQLEAALSAAAANADLRVLIQVRKGAPTQRLVDVLERVRGIGIKNMMVSR